MAPLRRGGSFSGFVERRPIAGIVAWLYHNGPIGMLSVSFQLHATLRRRLHPRPFSLLYTHTHTQTYIYPSFSLSSTLFLEPLPTPFLSPSLPLFSPSWVSLFVAYVRRGCQDGYANRVTDFHPWKSHNLWWAPAIPAAVGRRGIAASRNRCSFPAPIN